MISQSGCNIVLVTVGKHSKITLEIMLHHTYSVRMTFTDLALCNSQHTHTTKCYLSFSFNMNSY